VLNEVRIYGPDGKLREVLPKEKVVEIHDEKYGMGEEYNAHKFEKVCVVCTSLFEARTGVKRCKDCILRDRKPAKAKGPITCMDCKTVIKVPSRNLKRLLCVSVPAMASLSNDMQTIRATVLQSV